MPVGRVVVAVTNFAIHLPAVFNDESGVGLAELVSRSTDVGAKIFIVENSWEVHCEIGNCDYNSANWHAFSPLLLLVLLALS
jgi:hypothetical protein